MIGIYATDELLHLNKLYKYIFIVINVNAQSWPRSMMSDLNSILMIRLVSSKHTIRRKKEEMESKGRTESGVFSYVYIPFSFIHAILQSLFVKFLGVRSPPSNFPVSKNQQQLILEAYAMKSLRVISLKQFIMYIFNS